jgi:hypothetical protein
MNELILQPNLFSSWSSDSDRVAKSFLVAAM